LIRVSLSIPESQVLDEMFADRIGSIIIRVARGRPAEQFLPAPSALQLIGMLHHVAGLMTKDAHALRGGAAFHLDDLFALEPHQARMREMKRERDTGRGVGAEPFARNPGVRLDPDVALLELVVEIAQADLEPRALHRDLEIPQA